VLEVIEPAVREGTKVALYACHTDVLDALQAGLVKWNVGFERIDGSVPTEKRTAKAKRFREDPECVVFLGQNIAAGAGIDLSSADWLIIVEPSYVPGDNAQVSDRVLNIAKNRPVQVQFAAIAGTIDDQIQAANIRKMEGIRALLG
jgi:SNF2 family DNA or RNA helicase